MRSFRASGPIAVITVLSTLLAQGASAQGRKVNGELEWSYASDAGSTFWVMGGRIAYAGLNLDGAGHDALLSAPLATGAPTVELTPIRGGYADGLFYHGRTPDGTRLLYVADQDSDSDYELYSVPADGSEPPVMLHPPLTGGDSFYYYQVAPDGEHVVLQLSIAGSYRLFTVPVNAPAPMIPLTPGVAVRDFAITSDASRVVFRNYSTSELHSVPLDGSAPPTRLVADPGLPLQVQGFSLSPDGQRVLYRIGSYSDYLFEIYSVPVDGSLPAVKLNGTNRVRGGFHAYAPDSSWVTFIPETELVVVRVPIQGGPAVQLTPFVAGRPVYAYWLTPDGSRIVYRADHEVAGRQDLYTVPSDGSQQAVRVSGNLAAGGALAAFEALWITPDSGRVLFTRHHGTSVYELYSAPVDGTLPPVRLHAPLANNRSVLDVKLDGGSGRVAFRIARYSSPYWLEPQLHSAPFDGSAPAVLLNSNRSPQDLTSVGEFRIDAASGCVVYQADEWSPDLTEFYRVPIDGSAPSMVVSDVRKVLNITGDVTSHATSPDGTTILYTAGQESGAGLYAAPVDGSAAPNLIVSGGILGDFRFSADSRWIVYDLDFGIYEPENRVFTVPLDGSSAPLTLTPVPIFGSVVNHGFTPDGTRVLFDYVKRDETGSLLYVVPRDRSAPLRELTGWATGSAGRFEVRPDSRSVVFLGGPRLGVTELYTVPLDGSRPPRRISAPSDADRDVFDFALSPDGRFAVYVANHRRVDVKELYSVELDLDNDGLPGRIRREPSTWHAPVRLNTLPSGREVLDFRVSPDSTHVVYRADAHANSAYSLFSVSIDSSTAPVILAAIDSLSEDVLEFQITPDSSRVVFRADLAVDEVVDLYCAFLAGGTPAVRLSAVPVAGGDVESFALSADSVRAVFRGDLASDEVYALYSVRLDQGEPAIALSPPLGADRDVYSLRAGGVQLDETGAWVLFTANVDVNERHELFLVPTDGSLAPRRLNGPLLDATGSVLGTFVPGGAHALHRAAQDMPGAIELYLDDL
ncbi:MAG TPA: hypothetical protein VF530_03310 [Planctomycetota bacterium]